MTGFRPDPSPSPDDEVFVMDDFGPGSAQPSDGEVFVIDDDDDTGADRRGRDGGPPRRMSVAARVGAGVGVAAVFAFGLAVGRTSLGTAPAEPSPSLSDNTELNTTVVTSTVTIEPPAGPATSAGESSGSADTSSAPTLTVLNDAFEAATLLPGADFQAVTVVGDKIVALAPGRFVEITATPSGSLYPTGTLEEGLPLGDPTYATWDLVTDGSAVWALTLYPQRRVYAMDPSTLRLGPLVGAPTGPVDAAAIDGHLYLNTENGVFDLTPSTRPGGELPLVARGGQSMAADPSRHRLLVLNDDGGWVIHGYDLSQPGSPVVDAPLPFEAQQVAVAGDQIWVTGLTNDSVDQRPVLARLDPATLQVVARSGLEESLTSAPMIVAAGTELWIRIADDLGALWRLDTVTGGVVQQWPAVPGLVAVTADQAFVIDGKTIGRLRLDAHAH